MLWLSKYVYQFDWPLAFISLFQIRVTFFTEDLTLSRVHWNDLIALSHHKCRHLITRFFWIRREPDDSDLPLLQSVNDAR